MRELAGTLEAWRAEGVEIGRAVVVRAFGSAPRPEGAVLLASADGRIAGSVSGGCVERAAAEEINNARRDGRSRVIRYGISDEQAWDVGLACGGTIDVLVEPLVRPEVEAAARDSAGLEAGSWSPIEGPANRPAGRGRAIVIPLPADAPGAISGPHTPGRGEPPPATLAVTEDGHLEGTLGEPAADAELVRLAMERLRRGASAVVEVAGRSLFVEVYPVRPRLVIVGAVQAAIPLVALARQLGYETVVIDARAAFATRERFPDVDRLVVAWPDEAADEIELGPVDAVAILSHDVKFDEPAIVTGLQRGCWYVGAIGSRKTQAQRTARLLAQGVPTQDLARLRGPIGLDLGGRSPAEVALAIIAEIVALRRGGTGRPLRDRAGELPGTVSEAVPGLP
jgi:xanthine dehydrogenase accessory factor